MLSALSVSKSDLEKSLQRLKLIETDKSIEEEEELNLAIALSLENKSSQATTATSHEKSAKDDLPSLEEVPKDEHKEEDKSKNITQIHSPFTKS